MKVTVAALPNIKGDTNHHLIITDENKKQAFIKIGLTNYETIKGMKGITTLEQLTTEMGGQDKKELIENTILKEDTTQKEKKK